MRIERPVTVSLEPSSTPSQTERATCHQVHNELRDSRGRNVDPLLLVRHLLTVAEARRSEDTEKAAWTARHDPEDPVNSGPTGMRNKLITRVKRANF